MWNRSDTRCGLQTMCSTRFIGMLSAVVALGLLACSQPSVPDTPSPDVVLVVVDTTRADAMGWAGSQRPTTPHLDKLAAESTWFSRAYAASSWTLPSMATLLTGEMPWVHGAVREPTDPNVFGKLDPEILTLASRMKAAGYRTGAFVNNNFLVPEFGLHRGFDTYDYEGAEPVDHRSAATTVNKALEWLNASEEPAFLLVHVLEPHMDYQVPEPFKGRFTEGLPHTLELPVTAHLPRALALRKMDISENDRVYLRAAYDEEVLTADAALGTLVEGLRARENWAQTRLALTSDHGEEFWDHGHFEHGHSLFSELTRVPLVLKLPGAPTGENPTIVEHASLPELLATSEGWLADLTRSGLHDKTRMAISEGILYGSPQASITSETLRLVVELDNKSLTLWPLDENGVEPALSSIDPAITEAGRPLFQALAQRRGGTEPTPPPRKVAMPEPETFEQLRALGYVE